MRQEARHEAVLHTPYCSPYGRRRWGESEAGRAGIRSIDLETIGKQAERIFGGEAGESATLDLDGTGGNIFLQVLLQLVMYDYLPVVSGALTFLPAAGGSPVFRLDPAGPPGT